MASTTRSTTGVHVQTRGELWKEATDFMRQHGIDWPGRAMARMSDLAASNDRAGIEHWTQVVALLNEFHRPDVSH